ncbi:hypothetical protein TNCV_1434311 [Trichonephila clavipes]|nr:hypothetical protein TNCV_1434311 [Trichonephila clavipes]
MTPELAPPLLTTTPHQREDVSALDRFNVHCCPTRYTRAFGDGPRNFEPWSSDEDDTCTESVPQPDEIGIVIVEVADFVKQINLEVDSDGGQELLDSHNQELTIDERVEMKHALQAFRPFFDSNDLRRFYRLTRWLPICSASLKLYLPTTIPASFITIRREEFPSLNKPASKYDANPTIFSPESSV